MRGGKKIVCPCSFFSVARRTNQEAPPLLSGFWVRRYGRRRGLRNSLRSDSPRPFSSVFLTTSPTDKGGDFARAFASLFNPLALRALPLYSFQEHRGRGGLPLLSLLRVFLRPLLIAMLLGSPLYFAAQKHPAMLRDTGEEGEMYFPFASASIYVQHLVMLWDTVGGSLIPDLLLLQPMFSTPPSFGHLPYILRYKTQRRSF